ncbi:hypothetical protein FGK63_07060 [Ruegeria sediminis]|uniref:SRPBCC family protein n=1 Tax=Ruegeria sediminis TaxID=2583820 RepID=A0ABY2X0X8_9RHOB|nr:hypothetical protein [Ruegeria sediminis]TMV08872.1 hypothetical protein FGK63_07060 [Ruegeria sediminis]
MIRKLTFRHVYPADPDRLFELVTDLDTLEAVTRPWMRFHHLPSGPVREGQVIDVDMSLFGFLPARPYKMVVTRCTGAEHQMTSDETGYGTHLVHRLEVRPGKDGRSELIDTIEIEAGWMTPLIALWLRLTHRWRHHVRLRLLRA